MLIQQPPQYCDGVSRRALLRAALLGLPVAVVSAACGVAPNSAEPATVAPALGPSLPAVDLLVLGAGAAGLAAAAELHTAGAELHIIEARDRLGGRVWTDASLGVPLDLGASWIHGVSGNPLSELVERLGIDTAPTDYDNLQAYDYDGAEVDDARHARIDAGLEELLEAAEEERERRVEESLPDIALQGFFDQTLAGRRISDTRRRELAYVVNTSIEHEYAADAAELSLLHYDVGFGEFAGGDVLFPGGYGQIIAGLADGLPVEPGQAAREVAYGPGGVTISTDKGSYRAERAVITLPLGVLKAGSVRFTPELPAPKLAAISRLGSGVLNKLYLRFPQVFWDNEYELLGHIGERKGEWAEFLNIAFYTGEPILLCFNAARYGREIEASPDEAIVAAALRVLGTIYNNVLAPTNYVLSRWASDPYAGGAYSFVPPGAGPTDHAALAAPVAGRLFFAGEATSAEHPSTVHGALLSGRRAAREVLGEGRRMKDEG